jgi:hypothetical protein
MSDVKKQQIIRPGQRKPATGHLGYWCMPVGCSRRGGGAFAAKSQPPEPDMTKIPKMITKYGQKSLRRRPR